MTDDPEEVKSELETPTYDSYKEIGNKKLRPTKAVGDRLHEALLAELIATRQALALMIEQHRTREFIRKEPRKVLRVRANPKGAE